MLRRWCQSSLHWSRTVQRSCRPLAPSQSDSSSRSDWWYSCGISDIKMKRSGWHFDDAVNFDTCGLNPCTRYPVQISCAPSGGNSLFLCGENSLFPCGENSLFQCGENSLFQCGENSVFRWNSVIHMGRILCSHVGIILCCSLFVTSCVSHMLPVIAKSVACSKFKKSSFWHHLVEALFTFSKPFSVILYLSWNRSYSIFNLTVRIFW